MRKKRILWVNDASWKGTGYAVYSNEVLSRLNKVEDFEVAEIACYADKNDPHIKDVPWKVYANRPLETDPNFENYVKNPSLIFGENVFNEVLLDFMPDIVMDIRDWWMFEYQQRSPFREFFHWSIMPAVDASPQNPQWINTYASADSVFGYCEFSKETLENQSDKINFIDIASPAANANDFVPVKDKATHKDNMGLDANSIIVGTVMRNQRRKLYPDLFKAFRMFLDETKNPNVFLFCHKYYPDIGWETPALLDMFGLSNRVLFSYKCQECKHISVDFFKDSVTHCEKCKKFSKRLVGVDNTMSNEELSKIYNLFDVYVQYANSEGFGMPQLEAAYCGIPVMTIYYSAMKSVADNIGAIPIYPIEYSMECETGCYRAIPNNQQFVEKLKEVLSTDFRSAGLKTAELARKHYSWDKTANAWIDHFRTIPLKDHSETWRSPPKIFEPATTIPSEIIDLKDQINYIFRYVLHKPEWIGGYFWSKVLKDITFGYRVRNSEDDYYFNESHMPAVDKYQKFNFVMAVNELTNLRNQWNQWERLRSEHVARF